MEINVAITKLQLIQDDITNVKADAIVNAANSTLLGGGGVDGAIHRVGGPKILEECKKIRATDWPDGLPTGQAVITSGGNLKAKFVIHTVGPIWRGGLQDESKLLRLAYRNCLKLAVQKGLKTVAFPSISTGAYGYPTEEAAQVALKAVVDFLKSDDDLERVTFVLFSKVDFDIYANTLKGLY
ncbi:MAG: O-acetyl-ADP-ribose deacetylase [Candidatus Bathyarchaeota archaeon]|nr:O-acetyl-ADP-ribose deacetylase [Candidatus Bathyarchaeota archaeon]